MPLRSRSITPDRQFQHPQHTVEGSDYRKNPILNETGFSQKLKTGQRNQQQDFQSDFVQHKLGHYATQQPRHDHRDRDRREDDDEASPDRS